MSEVRNAMQIGRRKLLGNGEWKAEEFALDRLEFLGFPIPNNKHHALR